MGNALKKDKTAKTRKIFTQLEILFMWSFNAWDLFLPNDIRATYTNTFTGINNNEKLQKYIGNCEYSKRLNDLQYILIYSTIQLVT